MAAQASMANVLNPVPTEPKPFWDVGFKDPVKKEFIATMFDRYMRQLVGEMSNEIVHNIEAILSPDATKIVPDLFGTSAYTWKILLESLSQPNNLMYQAFAGSVAQKLYNSPEFRKAAINFIQKKELPPVWDNDPETLTEHAKKSQLWLQQFNAVLPRFERFLNAPTREVQCEVEVNADSSSSSESKRSADQVSEPRRSKRRKVDSNEAPEEESEQLDFSAVDLDASQEEPDLPLMSTIAEIQAQLKMPPPYIKLNARSNGNSPVIFIQYDGGYWAAGNTINRLFKLGVEPSSQLHEFKANGYQTLRPATPKEIEFLKSHQAVGNMTSKLNLLEISDIVRWLKKKRVRVPREFREVVVLGKVATPEMIATLPANYKDGMKDKERKTTLANLCRTMEIPHCAWKRKFKDELRAKKAKKAASPQ